MVAGSVCDVVPTGVAVYGEALQAAVETEGSAAVSAVASLLDSVGGRALTGDAGDTSGGSAVSIWRICSRSTAGTAGLAAMVGRKSGKALARYSSTSGAVLGSEARRSSSKV